MKGRLVVVRKKRVSEKQPNGLRMINAKRWKWWCSFASRFLLFSFNYPISRHHLALSLSHALFCTKCSRGRIHIYIMYKGTEKRTFLIHSFTHSFIPLTPPPHPQWKISGNVFLLFWNWCHFVQYIKQKRKYLNEKNNVYE